MPMNTITSRPVTTRLTASTRTGGSFASMGISEEYARGGNYCKHSANRQQAAPRGARIGGLARGAVMLCSRWASMRVERPNTLVTLMR